MKVVIFGTGYIYQINKEWIPFNHVLSFIDNDINKQGHILDGIPINNPEYILHNTFDKIIVMSTKIQEMRDQLLNMGVPIDLIWTWKRYQSELMRGILKLFCDNQAKVNYKKRILVLSTHLNYDGGTMAVVYAVQALQSKGYLVVLAGPSGNSQFINEMVSAGINVILCPSLYYLDKSEMYWIKQFDIVLVNTFYMLPCVCEISKVRPVMWWLHEPGPSFCNIYGITREEFLIYDDVSKMRQINIVAVSEIAKRNFEVYYPGLVQDIMPYAIPDEYFPAIKEKDSEKLTFAIIGNICERKAQNIFVQAISNFERTEMEQLEFLIIGEDIADAYCDGVRAMAAEIPQIKLLGRLTREQMKTTYPNIDVVVCASMEETMSVVVTEGMKHSKVCITTDSTGMAEYITNGVNGFICKAGDVDSLYESMKWIAEHEDELHDIRENARKTYEKHFTMEAFGENLERLLFHG